MRKIAMQRYQTCRKCGELSFHPYDEMFRTGIRHWYHFRCYFETGKSIESLRPSEVGRIPYRLLKDLNLLTRAEEILGFDKKVSCD
jgi:hypothetical protein